MRRGVRVVRPGDVIDETRAGAEGEHGCHNAQPVILSVLAKDLAFRR